MTTTRKPTAPPLEILGGNGDELSGWGPFDAATFAAVNGPGEYTITVRVPEPKPSRDPKALSRCGAWPKRVGGYDPDKPRKKAKRTKR